MARAQIYDVHSADWIWRGVGGPYLAVLLDESCGVKGGKAVAATSTSFIFCCRLAVLCARIAVILSRWWL